MVRWGGDSTDSLSRWGVQWGGDSMIPCLGVGSMGWGFTCLGGGFNGVGIQLIPCLGGGFNGVGIQLIPCLGEGLMGWEFN